MAIFSIEHEDLEDVYMAIVQLGCRGGLPPSQAFRLFGIYCPPDRYEDTMDQICIEERVAYVRALVDLCHTPDQHDRPDPSAQRRIWWPGGAIMITHTTDNTLGLRQHSMTQEEFEAMKKRQMRMKERRSVVRARQKYARVSRKLEVKKEKFRAKKELVRESARNIIFPEPRQPLHETTSSESGYSSTHSLLRESITAKSPGPDALSVVLKAALETSAAAQSHILRRLPPQVASSSASSSSTVEAEARMEVEVEAEVADETPGTVEYPIPGATSITHRAARLLGIGRLGRRYRRLRD